MIDEQTIRQNADGVLPYRFYITESLDSTNAEAARRALVGDAGDLVVIADGQTAGRGRLGRSFLSPMESGIYMSVLLRPSLSPEAATLLTPLAAVAAVRAIRDITGVTVGIKWVNDIVYRGRKLAGILTEGSVTAEKRLDFAVVGIGINVDTATFPDEVAAVAGALAPLMGVKVSREALIGRFLTHFHALSVRLPDTAFMDEYRAASVVLGKRVRVMTEVPYEATVVAIADSGALAVECDGGERCEISAGEVSLRLAAP